MNEHFEEAERLVDLANWNGADMPERQVIATQSQAKATLALAHAQHTANLIAFERAQWEAWRQDELNPEGVELWRKAAEQVNERLGLA